MSAERGKQGRQKGAKQQHDEWVPRREVKRREVRRLPPNYIYTDAWIIYTPFLRDRRAGTPACIWYIFHRGSRKVDGVNSIPRPRPADKPRRNDGGRESHPACIAVPFDTDVICALFLTSAGFYRSRDGRRRFQFCRTSIFRVLEYPPIRTQITVLFTSTSIAGVLFVH